MKKQLHAKQKTLNPQLNQQQLTRRQLFSNFAAQTLTAISNVLAAVGVAFLIFVGTLLVLAFLVWLCYVAFFYFLA